MKRLLPFLVLFGLTGCAVDGAVADTDATEADGPTGEAVGAASLPSPPPTTTPWIAGPIPKLTIPPPATCSNRLIRRAVYTKSCKATFATGGFWSARAIFTSNGRTLCDMQWHPNQFGISAPPGYAALEQIAEREDLSLTYPYPAAIRPLCDETVVCNPNLESCVSRAQMPPSTGNRPLGGTGMGGCSSCAFMSGDTVYAVLPSDYTREIIELRLGPDTIRVNPAGAQTFMIDVSSVPANRRADGFVTVSIVAP